MAGIIRLSKLADHSTYVLVADSIKGPGKLENQDSFVIRTNCDSIIVVVADGLGSAKYAADGSKMAAEAAAEILSQSNTSGKLAEDIFREWATKIAGSPNLFDTTCKFVKITAEEVLFGGVGDGWIAINTDDGFTDLKAASEFTNRTDGLSSPDLHSVFKICSIKTKRIRSLLIATDGFSEDFQKDKGSQLLESASNQIDSNPNEFLASLENLMENWPLDTNGDDKTVVFLRRHVG